MSTEIGSPVELTLSESREDLRLFMRAYIQDSESPVDEWQLLQDIKARLLYHEHRVGLLRGNRTRARKNR